MSFVKGFIYKIRNLSSSVYRVHIHFIPFMTVLINYSFKIIGNPRQFPINWELDTIRLYKIL